MEALPTPPSSHVPSLENWQVLEHPLSGARGSGGGTGGRGLVTSVHMSANRPRMSATVRPRYENIEAGGVAIELSVAAFAPPKPTATSSASVFARSLKPDKIAALSPPKPWVCTPSVNSSTT